MTQSTKREPPRKQAGKTDQPVIPERYQHPAAILAIFLSLVIFFHEVVFNGRVFASSDAVAAQSFNTLVDDAAKEGTAPLWNPYVFCGMPGLASMGVGAERAYDITAVVLMKTASVFSFLNKDIGWVLFFYLLFGSGVYLLAEHKLQSKVVALLIALATLYSMYIIIWIMSFHLTKIAVMAFFPYIFYFIERLREKFQLSYSLLLVLCVHFLFLPGHIQMIFYTYFALGIYYLYFLVRAIVRKENWIGLLRSAGVLAVATALAFAMSADQYLSTLEYSKYSMRGADPIQSHLETGSQSEKKASGGGLDYDYATNWSFAPGEMLTFFIPSAYGFGNFDYSGSLTNNQTARLYTYFGPQSFTEAPQYMGVVILVLAFVGVVKRRRDPFVQFLLTLSIISLLISFGREFPILYDLMFKYFPLFNKFRIPSMILVLVQIAVPMLAGYGALELLSLRDRQLSVIESKRWKYFVVGLGVAAVLSLVARPVVESVYSSFFPEKEVMATVGSHYQPSVRSAIYGIMTAEVSADVSAALVLLTIAFAALWLYAQKMIKLPVLIGALFLAVIIDLWRIDSKPMETRDPRETHLENFGKPDYVQFLLQDTTLYRVLEFENGQTPYSNTFAYWRIQSAYGYQGAKMRAYQDVVDNVGLANPLLWGLMDVRYIISNTRDSSAIFQPVFQGSDHLVYRNRAELPRTFFVNRYEVSDGLSILRNIRNLSFNPRDIAYMMEDPKTSIDPAGESASAHFTKYDLHNVEIAASATGKNLLFISETYYPEGWKAYIDGAETPIYRLNYLFRGVIVPSGEHTVTMVFKPRGYYLGKTMSLTINVLVLGCLIVTGGVVINKRRKSLKNAQST